MKLYYNNYCLCLINILLCTWIWFILSKMIFTFTSITTILCLFCVFISFILWGFWADECSSIFPINQSSHSIVWVFWYYTTEWCQFIVSLSYSIMYTSWLHGLLVTNYFANVIAFGEIFNSLFIFTLKRHQHIKKEDKKSLHVHTCTCMYYLNK